MSREMYFCAPHRRIRRVSVQQEKGGPRATLARSWNMLVNFNDPIETAAWSVPVPFHFRPRVSFRSLSGRLAALRFRVLENADVSDSRFARLEPVCRLLSIEPASLVAITPRKIKIMFSRERAVPARKNAARNGAARHPRLSSHGPIFISPSPSVRGEGEVDRRFRT